MTQPQTITGGGEIKRYFLNILVWSVLAVPVVYGIGILIAIMNPLEDLHSTFQTWSAHKQIVPWNASAIICLSAFVGAFGLILGFAWLQEKRNKTRIEFTKWRKTLMCVAPLIFYSLIVCAAASICYAYGENSSADAYFESILLLGIFVPVLLSPFLCVSLFGWQKALKAGKNILTSASVGFGGALFFLIMVVLYLFIAWTLKEKM